MPESFERPFFLFWELAAKKKPDRRRPALVWRLPAGEESRRGPLRTEPAQSTQTGRSSCPDERLLLAKGRILLNVIGFGGVYSKENEVVSELLWILAEDCCCKMHTYGGIEGNDCRDEVRFGSS